MRLRPVRRLQARKKGVAAACAKPPWGRERGAGVQAGVLLCDQRVLQIGATGQTQAQSPVVRALTPGVVLARISWKSVWVCEIAWSS
jgi:hypothetical protein